MKLSSFIHCFFLSQRLHASRATHSCWKATHFRQLASCIHLLILSNKFLFFSGYTIFLSWHLSLLRTSLRFWSEHFWADCSLVKKQQRKENFYFAKTVCPLQAVSLVVRLNREPKTSRLFQILNVLSTCVCMPYKLLFPVMHVFSSCLYQPISSRFSISI